MLKIKPIELAPDLENLSDFLSPIPFNVIYRVI